LERRALLGTMPELKQAERCSALRYSWKKVIPLLRRRDGLNGDSIS
jgi:hypothetical protein